MKIAIADIGSNTVKMTVFSEDNTILYKKSVPVGLIGYVKDGILSSQGIAILTETLAHFLKIALKEGADTLYPFATASLRAAKNSGEVIAHVKNTLGLTVDLVSGEEEAFLSLRGVSLSLAESMEHAVLLDMGGGSLEVISAKEKARSFPFGSLLLYRQFVSNILPTKEELTAIYRHVRDTAGKEELPREAARLLAVGGTLRAFCRFHAKIYGKAFSEEIPYTVTRDELVMILTVTTEMAIETRTMLLQLIPDRIHTFATGVSAILAMMDLMGMDSLTVVAGGAREGYLIKIKEVFLAGK